MTSPAEPTRWKLNREISVVDLITIISAIFALAFAYNTMDKRVALTEQAVITITRDQAVQDADRAAIRQENATSRAEFREVLRDINGKLDRLIESRNGRK